MAWLGISAVVVVAAAVASWRLTWSRAQQLLEQRASGFEETAERQRVQGLQQTATARRAAEVDRSAQEERERLLVADVDRLQQRTRALATICQLDAEPLTPIYGARAAPVELDAIARRVRGLAFIDSLTIADASGFPLDRSPSRDADDLASLVPTLARVATRIGGALASVGGVVIYTTDARVVELRALPTWTGGAWLVAQASAQRPPVAALDAAVAYAAAVRGLAAPREVAPTLSTSGRLGGTGARSEALAGELERATRGLATRTVALVAVDQVLSGMCADGVGPAVLATLVRGFQELQQVAVSSLRSPGIARIEIDMVGATRLSYSPLATGSRLALLTLTVGRALDPLEVERVVGRLRRFLDSGGSGSVVAPSAGGAYA